METKSRYEVISDLEKQKRELIKERDSLNIALQDKEKELKVTERAKSDQMMGWDRKIEDVKEDLENFKSTMEERKETIKELIKSVDESLNRFSQLNKKSE